MYVKQKAVDSSMNVLETQLLPRASLLAHVLSKQATWLNVHVSTTTVSLESPKTKAKSLVLGRRSERRRLLHTAAASGESFDGGG
jgi:hypothetical protein